MTFALRYAVRSDVGLLREGNEDSAYAGPHLLAVADGMGGYEAGEVASASVIKSVATLDRPAMPESELIDAFGEAVAKAKQNLRGIVEADPAVGSMGTTLTAMLWSGPTVAICHIGDSRAYLLRDGDLYQITRDHTFVQALIDQGRIRPDQAANHPQRSLLLRALDGRTDADPDLSLLTTEVGDRFLLCSDGLPVAVKDEQILQALAHIADPSQAVLELIDLAIRGGGPDNITCIVADVIDTDRSQWAPSSAPVLAGAAAGAGIEQTKAFSKIPADADSGITRIGSAPAAGAWHSSTAVDVDHDASLINDRPGAVATAPGARATASRPGRAAHGAGARRSGRRRLPLMTTLIGLFVLLIVGGLIVGYQVVRSQYYVGASGGKVTIFRGMNDKILGFSLSSVYKSTDIPVSGIPSAFVPELRRTDSVSLAMAQQFVANIRRQYDTCQQAEAAVRSWEAHKPKPRTVKRRVDGRIVTRKVTPKYPPKPGIPGYCPTTSTSGS
jgi:PPM family protein phosphatase